MRTKSSTISKRQLDKFLKKYPDWTTNKRETQLQRSFDFPDYISGLVFMARITVHAEIANHHPEATLSYGKVKVTLSTHDVKGLTKKDLELAGKIEFLSRKD